MRRRRRYNLFFGSSSIIIGEPLPMNFRLAHVSKPRELKGNDIKISRKILKSHNI